MVPILEDAQQLIREIASRLLGDRNFGCLPTDSGENRNKAEKGNRKPDNTGGNSENIGKRDSGSSMPST
jgi:hypothetical protein